MAHKLIRAARQRYSRLAGRRSASTTVNNSTSQSHLLHRRSGLELTGAFLFIALLIAAGDTLHADNTTAHTTSNAPTNGSAVQLTQTSSNSALPDNDSNSNAGGSSSTTAQTTQVSSDNTNGNTTTKVTVDGKPVNVPANGTTTVTNGDTTTTVSNDSSGSAVNTVNAQSNVNVYSPPVSPNVGSEVGVTPLMPY